MLRASKKEYEAISPEQGGHTRDVKLYKVTDRQLVAALRGELTADIPAGAELLSVHYDPENGCSIVVFQHPTFHEARRANGLYHVHELTVLASAPPVRRVRPAPDVAAMYNPVGC